MAFHVAEAKSRAVLECEHVGRGKSAPLQVVDDVFDFVDPFEAKHVGRGADRKERLQVRAIDDRRSLDELPDRAPHVTDRERVALAIVVLSSVGGGGTIRKGSGPLTPADVATVTERAPKATLPAIVSVAVADVELLT